MKIDIKRMVVDHRYLELLMQAHKACNIANIKFEKIYTYRSNGIASSDLEQAFKKACNHAVYACNKLNREYKVFSRYYDFKKESEVMNMIFDFLDEINEQERALLPASNY